MPSSNALSTPIQKKPCWVETVATHRLHRALLISVKGWDRDKGLEAGVMELGPGSSLAGDSEPLLLYQAVPDTQRDLQDPMQVGWAAVPLSFSLAHSLPLGHGVRPHAPWKGRRDGPVATLVRSPRGAVMEQLGAQVFLISAGPGSECTVGAPGWVPRYLDSSPSRYSRATS